MSLTVQEAKRQLKMKSKNELINAVIQLLITVSTLKEKNNENSSPN